LLRQYNKPNNKFLSAFFENTSAAKIKKHYMYSSSFSLKFKYVSTYIKMLRIIWIRFCDHVHRDRNQVSLAAECLQGKQRDSTFVHVFNLTKI
jgi:hypothetical protein